MFLLEALLGAVSSVVRRACRFTYELVELSVLIHTHAVLCLLCDEDKNNTEPNIQVKKEIVYLQGLGIHLLLTDFIRFID